MQSETSCLHGIWPQWTGMRGLQNISILFFLFIFLPPPGPIFVGTCWNRSCHFHGLFSCQNLRQQLTLSLALLGCRSQCQINYCRRAIWLLRPLFFLWDTMKYWSRMAGTLCSISSMVWTIVLHVSHRWAFGMYRKSTDFVQSFRTCLHDLRLYNKW